MSQKTSSRRRKTARSSETDSVCNILQQCPHCKQRFYNLKHHMDLAPCTQLILHQRRENRAARLNQMPPTVQVSKHPSRSHTPEYYTTGPQWYETTRPGISLYSYPYLRHSNSAANARPLSRNYARSPLSMSYPPSQVANVPISHHARSQTPTPQRLAHPQPMRYYSELLLRAPSMSSTVMGSPSPGMLSPDVKMAPSIDSVSNYYPPTPSSSSSFADDNPFAFIPWDPRFPLRPPNGGFTIGPNESYDDALLRLENWIREHTGLHPERGDLDNYVYTGADPIFWLPDGDRSLPFDGLKL